MITRLVLACGLLSTGAAFANGGGYFLGGVERTGDIEIFEPEEVEKIRMLDENLEIGLGPKEATVEIRYLMKNETDGKVKIRFGFPVEELFMQEFSDESEAETYDKGKLMYCKDYVITAGGTPIASKWREEKGDKVDKRRKGISGWLVSDLSFAPGQEIPVAIRFKSSYPIDYSSVSDDTFERAAIFNYRLSTAACWASTIGKGRITVRAMGIPADEIKVLKPVNRFKKEGDAWVWNFEKLEPTMADDLEIEAVPEIHSYARAEGGKWDDPAAAPDYVARGDKWMMRHRNYSVTASSTLPPEREFRYDAAQLKQRGEEGTWSEGNPGPGIGEWLELKPAVPKPLMAILMTPGYAGSPERFKENARPKRVSVKLNDDYKFDVEVPDSADEFRIPVTGYTKPVSKIRLTFTDVWRGSRFEDLCVTALQLEAKLDKEPKIQPAR